MKNYIRIASPTCVVTTYDSGLRIMLNIITGLMGIAVGQATK